jgi:peptide/nickel transport system permease protein
MGKYISKRLLLLLPILLGVSIVVFALVNVLPSDPISIMLGSNPQLPPDPKVVASLRAQYGLDQPLHVQYFRFLGRVLHGDLGTSIFTQQSVLRSILERMPATLLLTLASLMVSLLIAIPIGVLSAVKQYSWVDTLSLAWAMLGVSMPSFWFGLLLILFFSLQLGWLPVSGMGSFEAGIGDVLRHLVMPAVTLGMGLAGLVTRVTRSSMLEVLRRDYIRTARAKGLTGLAMLWRHAFKNAAIPVLTIVGVQFGSLLGGAVVVETIFSWPGVGRLAVNAIMNRDLPMIQGSVLVFTLLFVLVNLIVDLLYAYIDPRIHYD